MAIFNCYVSSPEGKRMGDVQDPNSIVESIGFLVGEQFSASDLDGFWWIWGFQQIGIASKTGNIWME